MYIDVHAHLADGKYGGQVESLVESYRNVGVGLVINSGYDIPSSIAVMEQSERFGDMFFSAGVHPDEAKTLDNQSIDRLIGLAKHQKCVAVGEIGFDFYWNKSTEQEQIYAFEKQMEIADHLKAKKPVVINLENVETAVARRIIDFLTGAVYAVDGSIQKIADRIFLIAPYNVGIMGGDVKDELMRNKIVFPYSSN